MIMSRYNHQSILFKTFRMLSTYRNVSEPDCIRFSGYKISINHRVLSNISPYIYSYVSSLIANSSWYTKDILSVV